MLLNNVYSVIRCAKLQIDRASLRKLEKENMKIKGAYHHIHLLSENPQVATQWYVQNLDGEIEGQFDVRGSIHIRIRIGEAQLIIRGLGPGETAVKHGDAKLVGIDHFALVPNDIEALECQLKENGVKIVKPIFTTTTGGRAFFIEGPDGVLIEIVEN